MCCFCKKKESVQPLGCDSQVTIVKPNELSFVRFNRFLISFGAEVKLNRRIIYRVGTSLPKRGSLSLSKQCFKKISFPRNIPNENSFSTWLSSLCLLPSPFPPLSHIYLCKVGIIYPHELSCVFVPSLPLEDVSLLVYEIGCSLPFPGKYYFPSQGARRELSSTSITCQCLTVLLFP